MLFPKSSKALQLMALENDPIEGDDGPIAPNYRHTTTKKAVAQRIQRVQQQALEDDYGLDDDDEFNDFIVPDDVDYMPPARRTTSRSKSATATTPASVSASAFLRNTRATKSSGIRSADEPDVPPISTTLTRTRTTSSTSVPQIQSFVNPNASSTSSARAPLQPRPQPITSDPEIVALNPMQIEYVGRYLHFAKKKRLDIMSRSGFTRPESVFNDQMLRRIAIYMPRDLDELKDIPGISVTRASDFAGAFVPHAKRLREEYEGATETQWPGPKGGQGQPIQPSVQNPRVRARTPAATQTINLDSEDEDDSGAGYHNPYLLDDDDDDDDYTQPVESEYFTAATSSSSARRVPAPPAPNAEAQMQAQMLATWGAASKKRGSAPEEIQMPRRGGWDGGSLYGSNGKMGGEGEDGYVGPRAGRARWVNGTRGGGGRKTAAAGGKKRGYTKRTSGGGKSSFRGGRGGARGGGRGGGGAGPRPMW